MSPSLFRTGITSLALVAAIAAGGYVVLLAALYFAQEKPRGLLFFLHGNACNLQTWTTGVEFYRRVNYDLFILDYRGYGKSSGRIESEAELHADVRAAWDAVAPGYHGKPIVTDQLIGDITSPVLLVHGSRDTLIPLADSEKLRTLVRSAVDLLVVDGAGHDDIHRFPAYLEPLAAQLLRLGGG